MGVGEKRWERWIPADVDTRVGRLQKSLGSFGHDPWGYDVLQVKRAFAWVNGLYEHVLGVRTVGMERIPATGRLLLVPNRSALGPLQVALLACAMMRNDAAPRAPRAVMDRSIPRLPWVGRFLSGIGGVVGDSANCASLLAHEEALIVLPDESLPGGVGSVARPLSQRLGSRFIQLAAQCQVPVLPVGMVGFDNAWALGSQRFSHLISMLTGAHDGAHGAPRPPSPVIAVGEALYLPRSLETPTALEAAGTLILDHVAACVQRAGQLRKAVVR